MKRPINEADCFDVIEERKKRLDDMYIRAKQKTRNTVFIGIIIVILFLLTLILF